MAKEEVHIDPVCGMDVTEKEAAGTSRYQGEKYYFCSDDCKSKFDANPAQFAVSPIPKA